jgi:predicted GTPase
MKQVFIKYNPYRLETEIKIDGKKLAQNSSLGERIVDGTRLQEWVEDLPLSLVEEYNDTEFEVEFHGTLLDYEDLIAVLTSALKNGDITGCNFNRKPAKETSDKERSIDEVFSEIQKGPFDELRADEIIASFNLAKSRDFEVCVVATMSAGKSTLINAMLGSKLMPSKQEACTAIITRIKDVTSGNEEIYIPFKAKVYDKKEQLSEFYEKLTYPVMERLNSDENVSEIKVFGNIPFVSSEDVSLILIDTPGPNNSRDERHLKVQSELLGKSSKALVLYIMTGEFGTDDDNALLNRVAESMAVSGKQSKDRFIFVVNKLDDRKKEDGDTNQTLERIRAYLKTHGIVNPNLFPAGALPALLIRQFKNGELNKERDIEEFELLEPKIKKFNRNQNGGMHFETYATLPSSIRDDINGQIEATRSEWESAEKPANENPREALIHTGVVSIEAAINQYVQKYAKTAKVKNIVDTFMHKLDELRCFEKTKLELAANQEESKSIVKHIDSIRKKMDDAKEAKKFKDEVDDAVVKVTDRSKELIEDIIQKFQSRISSRIAEFRDQELKVNDAKDEVERLKKFAKSLEPDFEADINELIHKNLIRTGTSILDKYKNKLTSLTDEIDIKGLAGITIDPLSLMGGSMDFSEYSVNHLINEEKREAGTEYYQDKERRGWFESFFFWPKEEWVTKTRTKYETVQFVDGSKLAQEFFTPIQQSLSENGDYALVYARKQSKKIADRFNAELKRLDDILKDKLSKLESYATDYEQSQKRIIECESKLRWLEMIKSKVESILEI